MAGEEEEDDAGMIVPVRWSSSLDKLRASSHTKRTILPLMLSSSATIPTPSIASLIDEKMLEWNVRYMRMVSGTMLAQKHDRTALGQVRNMEFN